MRTLSLFSGIGGLDLGLERAGFTIVGQVELDPFCRASLAKHWPGVPRIEDVRAVRGDEFGPVDCVVGGVPCQPASCAGKRKGAGDDRWLWPEFVRLVRATGCSWFLAENVRGFLSLPDSRGVVRDLEGAGYEIRTLLLGARHVGAPHRRDRIWIVGRLAESGLQAGRRRGHGRGQQQQEGGEGSWCVAHPDRRGLGIDGGAGGHNGHAHEQGARRLVHPSGPRLEGHGSDAGQPQGREPRGAGAPACWPARPGEPQHEWEEPRLVYSNRNRLHGSRIPVLERGSQQAGVDVAGPGTGSANGLGLAQPSLGSATHGVPGGLAGRGGSTAAPTVPRPAWRRAALQATGNAVVPDVAEVIGRAILAAKDAA